MTTKKTFTTSFDPSFIEAMKIEAIKRKTTVSELIVEACRSRYNI